MKPWIPAVGLAIALFFAMNATGWSKEATKGTKAAAPAAAPRESLKYTPTEWPEAPDTAGMLRRLVVGTTIVLVLCVGTMVAGRRWLRGTPARSPSGNLMHLLETVSLGNRCSVHLVQVGDQQVLVGVDGNGVKSLVPLPPSFERALADSGSPVAEPSVEYADTENE